MAAKTSEHAKSAIHVSPESTFFKVPMQLSNRLLRSVAKEYGTPTYVYNADLIVQQYKNAYKFIKWPKLQIFYAMKANYNPDILRLLRDCGACVDTVSPGDVRLALKNGYPPGKLLYTAVNITDAEMREVKELGVLMNVGEISRLKKYGKAYPGTEICLRFNPEVKAGEFVQIQTAGVLSKFGILMEDIETVKKTVSKYRLKVVGLHSHTGSGIADTEKFFESMKKIASLATRENFPHLRFLDFGGGFKVPYKPEEHRIDYVKFGEEITTLISSFSERYGRPLELYFEPGKYMVAESGYLLVEANTIRNNRGRVIVGVNSGFPQLIRPVLYGAYHHIINVTNPQGKPTLCDLAGNVCEGGDVFAENRLIPKIRENDIIGLLCGGAYGYAMGGNYNLRPMPAEVIVRWGAAIRSTRRKSSAELADQIMRRNE
ncbi:MAG: diaminopimelate decarboxylase [Candidatus Micrarchaeota archaeon]|nr:diaminopimelate decarboxylase [Candidatus Micrarchaeota archaeon]